MASWLFCLHGNSSGGRLRQLLVHVSPTLWLAHALFEYFQVGSLSFRLDSISPQRQQRPVGAMLNLIQKALAAAGAFVEAIQHDKGAVFLQSSFHNPAHPHELALASSSQRDALPDHRSGKHRLAEAFTMAVEAACKQVSDIDYKHQHYLPQALALCPSVDQLACQGRLAGSCLDHYTTKLLLSLVHRAASRCEQLLQPNVLLHPLVLPTLLLFSLVKLDLPIVGEMGGDKVQGCGWLVGQKRRQLEECKLNVSEASSPLKVPLCQDEIGLRAMGLGLPNAVVLSKLRMPFVHVRLNKEATSMQTHRADHLR